jgi:hypothetical protein
MAIPAPSMRRSSQLQLKKQLQWILSKGGFLRPRTMHLKMVKYISD